MANLVRCHHVFYESIGLCPQNKATDYEKKKKLEGAAAQTLSWLADDRLGPRAQALELPVQGTSHRYSLWPWDEARGLEDLTSKKVSDFFLQ